MAGKKVIPLYDIAVTGGGPAGLAAAIHARARDKNVVVLSSEPTASPLCRAERVDNYPGLPQTGGRTLVETFLRQARALGAEFKQGRVLNVMPRKSGFMLSVGPDVVEARAVILATGLARSAKLPGEAEYLGRGVSYCATCDGMLYRGKRVAVLGWTPSAKKEAEFLESIGCQAVYFDKPRDCAVLGAEKVEAVRCDGVTEAVEGVFLLRPAMAPGDLFPGLAAEAGFVTVDRSMATNLPGVFAAGDCTGGPLQVSKAVGEGLIAGQKAAAFAAALK